MQRALGMFAYYSKWIPNFSDIANPLYKSNKFPLDSKAEEAFKKLKDLLSKATLSSIDESCPFVVESDASDVAVSATLNQRGRPVAFMSRMLSGSEKHYHPVEKEATAVIEAIRKWSHLLCGKHFKIITDQRSVSFMFDSRKKTKVQNNKIQCWRLELAEFNYTIEYRPGHENVAADALTRAYCASSYQSKLKSLHDELGHPGVTRLYHYVKNKNLPFSTAEVKDVCSSCQTCAEVKPNFYKPQQAKLIKSTRPMERISIDFKGPLPSRSKNIYLFTAVDEYSRYPFAFPCSDMSSSTVIKCLSQIFSLCGMASYIHSDRGLAFMSREVTEFLTNLGVASSKSTPYHPTGNSQVERYNGIIWKTITLLLKTKNLSQNAWEVALNQALHSIRSLLSTATNTTPHEKFFSFERRSGEGTALPTWLTTPGTVYLRRFVRTSKNDPLVDMVKLLHANPTYAHIRYPDGRESSVSLKDLAPCPQSSSNNDIPEVNETRNIIDDDLNCVTSDIPDTSQIVEIAPREETLRRSSRITQQPNRYGYD